MPLVAHLNRNSLLLGSVLLLGLLLAFVPEPRFPLDDAYITLHNARSLIAGTDPLYGVNPLVGATSAVHLALLSGLGLIMPLPNAAMLICLLGMLAYVAGLWRFGKGVAFIGVAASYVPIHLVNGLETSLAMAATIWAINWADDPRLCYLAGIMPYIRPELAILAALLMARQLWLRRNWKYLAKAAVLALPWITWLMVATGSPWPNTMAAKATFFAEADGPIDTRVRYLLLAFAASLLAPLSVGLFLLWHRPIGRVLLAFLLIWITVVVAQLPRGFGFNDERYLAIAVPILCYGIASASWAIVLNFVVTAITALFALRQLQGELNSGFELWRAMAANVARLPPGSRVMIHDIGFVSWANPPVHLIDVVGLKSPRSINVMRTSSVRFCQWGPALDRIAVSERATHIVVLERQFWTCIGSNLRDEGWRLTPLYVQPNGFTVYRMSKP